MTRRVLLLDIGAGDLPATTPTPQTASSWFPVPYVAPPSATPAHFVVLSIVGGVRATWDAVSGTNVLYELQRAPDASGAPGAAETVYSGEARSISSNESTSSWWRVRTTVRGVPSDWTAWTAATPQAVPTPQDVQDAQDAADSAAELASQVQSDLADARGDIAAVQDQADDLRTDVDQTIADLNQEVADRTTAISNEASARATAISNEANARATAILNEQNTRAAAITAEQTIRQSADDSLAVTISQVSAGTGEQFDPAVIWYFDTTVEGWSGAGTPTIVDGWLRPANSSDPFVVSPTGLAVNGGSYRFSKLRIKKVGAPVWNGEIRWRLPGDATWRGPVSLPEPAFDASGVTTVAYQDVPWWPGTVDQIRFDLSPAQTDTDYFLIDWVAIGRPTPGAGVAALQDETAARVTADSAEATQRSTLATQMRGNYTGTDVEAVTSGLVYSERQARSSADGALATRAAALEARMPSGTGTLATSASVSDEATARANADGALSTRTSAMESRMPSGTGALATSASVTAESTARAGADSAIAADIALLGAHNDSKTAFILDSGKVNVTPTQTLAQYMTSVQASDTALGARIDSEQTARADGDSANATDIASMKVQLTDAGNLVATPDWVGRTDAGQWGSPATTTTSVVSEPEGRALSIPDDSTTYCAAFKVHPNEVFDVSVRILVAPGTTAKFGIRFADANNVFVSSGYLPTATNSGGFATITGTIPVPTGSAIGQPRIDTIGAKTGGLNTRVIWCRITRRTVSESANASSIAATNLTVSQQGDDIEANATQISTLTTTVGGHTASISTLTGTTNGLKAQAVMVMDVDGRLSGMKANATATESDITFLFDAVNFVSEDGTASIEGGRFITRSNGFMSVIGQPFGVGSEFIEWYGPELPLASCSRSNAITYKTKTGALYVKQIFVGARTFSAYNPYAAAAQEIILQVNDTAGGNISVALNYTRSVTRTGAGTTFSAGSGTAAAQVTLYRKVGTGAGTLVGTYNYTGGVDVLNVPDGLSRATTYVTGNSTFVDTTNNLQPRRYRAVVVSSTLQGVNYTGTAPAVQPEAGNLGLTSTE